MTYLGHIFGYVSTRKMTNWWNNLDNVKDRNCYFSFSDYEKFYGDVCKLYVKKQRPNDQTYLGKVCVRFCIVEMGLYNICKLVPIVTKISRCWVPVYQKWHLSACGADQIRLFNLENFEQKEVWIMIIKFSLLTSRLATQTQTVFN